MRWRNTANGYGLIQIAIHWTMAAMIAVLLPLGLWMTGLDYYDPWYRKGPDLHRAIGVLLGLLVSNHAFSLVNCGIGAIALAGIVVNNNIVLIDTFNQVRRTTDSAREAIMRTCAQRMRPVMLTTVTTVLGLMPMAFGMNFDILGRVIYFGGPSTQWWKQMASSIAGGLVFATILTLLLTPSLLMIQANISRRLRQRRQQRRADRNTAAA